MNLRKRETSVHKCTSCAQKGKGRESVSQYRTQVPHTSMHTTDAFYYHSLKIELNGDLNVVGFVYSGINTHTHTHRHQANTATLRSNTKNFKKKNKLKNTFIQRISFGWKT